MMKIKLTTKEKEGGPIIYDTIQLNSIQLLKVIWPFPTFW